PYPLPEGEGEPMSALRPLQAARVSNALPMMLPLPEGEGRGEGEQSVRIPERCDFCNRLPVFKFQPGAACKRDMISSCSRVIIWIKTWGGSVPVRVLFLVATL